MKALQFLEGIGNKNNVTVTICYLVSNGNDVTVTVCGNDAHHWVVVYEFCTYQGILRNYGWFSSLRDCGSCGPNLVTNLCYVPI
jgi:hypothetical protein